MKNSSIICKIHKTCQFIYSFKKLLKTYNRWIIWELITNLVSMQVNILCCTFCKLTLLVWGHWSALLIWGHWSPCLFGAIDHQYWISFTCFFALAGPSREGKLNQFCFFDKLIAVQHQLIKLNHAHKCTLHTSSEGKMDQNQ